VSRASPDVREEERSGDEPVDHMSIDEILALIEERPTFEDILALIEERLADALLFQLLGKLYIEKRRSPEARAAYERSLELDPDAPFTDLYLGNWYSFMRRPREALKRFKHAELLLPDEAVVYWCQGGAYQAMGRHELAGAAYQKAVRVDPDDPRARRELTEWYEFRYGEGKRGKWGRP
jgi:tetratricopeptide (TPR) repeat protein